MMILTLENWQQTVLDAIQSLPSDIRASVGIGERDERTIRLTIATAPLPGTTAEAEIEELRIVLTTPRAQRTPAHEDLEKTNALPNCIIEQLDWPMVAMIGSTFGGIFIGRGHTEHLAGDIQTEVLEKLYQGGIDVDGEVIVAKDKKGRYRRKDGSKILDWQ